jgi:hypothetical protein
VIVALTFRGVVITLVVPRRGRQNGRIGGSLLTAALWLVLGRGFELVARAGSRRWRGRDLKQRYEAEDQLLGRLAPVSLLSLLGAWLLLIFLGFSLMLWGDSSQSLAHALDLSGSSISTMGVRAPVGAGQTLVCYLAAASGLIVLAIEIGYLPTIYGHFNRREAQMRILESRAGRPAWGPEILVRQHNVAALDTMPDFYASWEAWSAELMESHLTFPWLMIFRSSDPLESWVTSLLAVLDSAALHLALCPTTAPNSRARQCLRMGFTTLRRLAEMLGIEYDEDPKPTDRIELTETEFELAVNYMKENGFPLERTPAEAWPDFRGWRVNYEPIAYELARRFHAPPVLWSGAPQSLNPLIVRDRSHDDPEGTKNRSLPDPPARSAPL